MPALLHDVSAAVRAQNARWLAPCPLSEPDADSYQRDAIAEAQAMRPDEEPPEDLG